MNYIKYLLYSFLKFKTKLRYYFANVYYPWKTFSKNYIDNSFYKKDSYRYVSYSDDDKFINLCSLADL